MMAEMQFDDLFKAFDGLRIGVVGDVMLDTYWWGKVDRISPEAPVPVVAVSKREQRIGGAGNVALNLRGLGVQVHMLTVAGEDEDAHQLTALMQQEGIDSSYMLYSRDRVTTNKIRIIGRNQQMMRLDAEITRDLIPEDEAALMAAFDLYLEKENPAIVILEDYNKGVLTTPVIDHILLACQKKNVPTAVDPKRKNFFAYRGVDIFKPNLQEAREALNLLQVEITLESLSRIHEALYEKLGHRISFITLSEKGVFYRSEDQRGLIPTHIRTIADVSGAGDTVIAVASAVYAVTKDVRLMAEMANIAGGLVCESVGTVAIRKDQLLRECTLLLKPAP